MILDMLGTISKMISRLKEEYQFGAIRLLCIYIFSSFFVERMVPFISHEECNGSMYVHIWNNFLGNGKQVHIRVARESAYLGLQNNNPSDFGRFSMYFFCWVALTD